MRFSIFKMMVILISIYLGVVSLAFSKAPYDKDLLGFTKNGSLEYHDASLEFPEFDQFSEFKLSNVSSTCSWILGERVAGSSFELFAITHTAADFYLSRKFSISFLINYCIINLNSKNIMVTDKQLLMILENAFKEGELYNGFVINSGVVYYVDYFGELFSYDLEINQLTPIALSSNDELVNFSLFSYENLIYTFIHSPKKYDNLFHPVSRDFYIGRIENGAIVIAENNIEIPFNYEPYALFSENEIICRSVNDSGYSFHVFNFNNSEVILLDTSYNEMLPIATSSSSQKLN